MPRGKEQFQLVHPFIFRSPPENAEQLCKLLHIY